MAASFQLPGLRLVDHVFDLPLNHRDPSEGTIEVFAREVRAKGPASEGLPWLVFLQGGPGFESPRPMDGGGWIGKATERFRVLLLDQRGTGRSSALGVERLQAVGDAAAQARHLAHFRADSIVRDCEAIRGLLGAEPWHVLGQSFGGFCTVHYLSTAPEGLAGAMITGGIPGLEVHALDVYRRTFPLTARKTGSMYRQFPGLEDRVREVFEVVLEGGVTLGSGDALTPERLQSIGAQLGFSTGAPQIHYLFERAFVPGSRTLSTGFLRGVENLQAFDTNPLYAVLHEGCYAQGDATGWAAQRARAEFPEFDAAAAVEAGRAPLFTGEMVFPWYFEQYGTLAPLQEAAEIVANRDSWPALYRPEVLAENDVPVAAVIYHDDMFVPADLSLQTAERIRGLDPWVTNEYEHDGLRADGARILGMLLDRL